MKKPPCLLLGAQDQQLGAEQDQLPCGPQEPLLANVKRQKLAWFGRVTRHDSLSKNYPSGRLGQWATPWSAKEMLDGQH